METRVRGERHPKTFLTSEQVTEIRRLYLAGGVTCAELGAQFGAHSRTIHFIVRRKTWAYVDDLPAPPHIVLAGERNGQAKLTSEQVLEIRARFAAGGCQKLTLAKEFGVSSTVIIGIIKRKAWKHI